MRPRFARFGRPAVTIALVGAIALSSCSSGESASTTSTLVGSTPKTVATGTPDLNQSGDLVLASELGRYKPRQADLRIYLLVARDISDGDLVSTATAWHRAEPDADLNFFDDDAEIDKIIALLPATAEGDTTGFPTDWIAQHQIARLQRFINVSDGTPWKLARGTSVDPADSIANLP